MSRCDLLWRFKEEAEVGVEVKVELGLVCLENIR